MNTTWEFPNGPTFWYLATPYSKYHLGLQSADVCARINTAILLKAGVPVFSPIAHSHAISQLYGMDAVDHDFWMKADLAIAAGAHGLIVLTMDGWDKSSGIQEEIEFFMNAGKPIVYMSPGDIPAVLT